VERTVRLPVGSKAGQCEFQLNKADRTIFSTTSDAQLVNGTTSFTLKVNLSAFPPGEYFVNVRQVAFDWNYYPVVLR